jgi:peptidoglycan/LPS O-acetylase OafA/YrhL
MASSLLVEFRSRIVVALGSAIMIYGVVRCGQTIHVHRSLLWLGKISYSLFLIHYLVNGIVLHHLTAWIGDSPLKAFASMLLALIASLIAADALYRWIELPVRNWINALS